MKRPREGVSADDGSAQHSRSSPDPGTKGALLWEIEANPQTALAYDVRLTGPSQ
jgi:hypothetical protein